MRDLVEQRGREALKQGGVFNHRGFLAALARASFASLSAGASTRTRQRSAVVAAKPARAAPIRDGGRRAELIVVIALGLRLFSSDIAAAAAFFPEARAPWVTGGAVIATLSGLGERFETLVAGVGRRGGGTDCSRLPEFAAFLNVLDPEEGMFSDWDEGEASASCRADASCPDSACGAEDASPIPSLSDLSW